MRSGSQGPYVMSNSNGYGHTRVDKRDFDANRPLLAADHDREDGQGRRRSGSGPSGLSANGADDGHSDGLLSEVVDNIPQFAPVAPYIPTHWWLSFDSLLRTPIDTTTLWHGLLSFAVYAVVGWKDAVPTWMPGVIGMIHGMAKYVPLAA